MQKERWRWFFSCGKREETSFAAEEIVVSSLGGC